MRNIDVNQRVIMNMLLFIFKIEKGISEGILFEMERRISLELQTWGSFQSIVTQDPQIPTNGPIEQRTTHICDSDSSSKSVSGVLNFEFFR